MLLSGTDNHLSGFGTMTGDHVGDQLGAPGYETYLNFRVASLAELLRDLFSCQATKELQFHYFRRTRALRRQRFQGVVELQDVNITGGTRDRNV